MSCALSLFDPPPVQPLTAQQRKADVIAWLETLVPLAQELARKAGKHGVTVSDLRIAAENRERMTGVESRTRGSYLGQVMQMAGLVNSGTYRRSTVPRSKRNLHAVWVLTEYARRSA